jgi:hypothetical protein
MTGTTDSNPHAPEASAVSHRPTSAIGLAAPLPWEPVAGHHIVPRFVIERWRRADGRVTLADLERLVVRDAAPQELDARPDFNRLEDAADPDVLEGKFFSGLESNAARAFDELVASRTPIEHAEWARNNGIKPGHLLKGKRAARLAQFLGAQAVRSPDWRSETNVQTAAAITEEVETKVRVDLERATDPAEIERVQGMLGLRYTAIVEGDTLPQLAAQLATHIGQVLYCEYIPTVMRAPAPMLCLGNDPVVFVDEDRAVGVGSYSQIAARRGTAPFSVRRDIESFVAAAVEVACGHKMIVMPIDPQHAIVLHPFKTLALPGRYDVDAPTAQWLNGLAAIASRRWLVVPPGRGEDARHMIYRDNPVLRKADLRRAERGLPLHTDPRAPSEQAQL